MIKKEYGKLKVRVLPNRKLMGLEAGKHIESILLDIIAEKEEARVVFASAPSQNETLDYLVNDSSVDWSKVVGFHMDEYIGLPRNAPQSFSKFIEDKFLTKVAFKKWNPMLTEGNPDEKINDYLTLLNEKPIDLVILGIGENGHLAFIDPPFCDFNDKEDLKIVTLDEVNRQQQVNDGAFEKIDDVPKTAMTMTIPFLMRVKHKIAIVPGPTKRNAIKNTLLGPVDPSCPASILRENDSFLYTDEEGFSYVD